MRTLALALVAATAVHAAEPTPSVPAPDAPATDAPATVLDPPPAPAPATVEVPVTDAPGVVEAPAADPAPGMLRPRRIAVYDFEGSGIDARTAAIVTDATVAELRKLKGVIVLSMVEVRAMLDLEAEKQLQGCADDSCLAEIAEALGADTLVIGSLARIGDGEVIAIRRVEQREVKTNGVVNQRLAAGSGEEFLAAIGPAVEALFPDHPLRAGAVRGVSDEIALLLNPPPLPVWIFLTNATATGGLAVGAGVITATWLGLDASFQSFRATKHYTLAEFDERAQPVATANTATWIAWSVVGATALSAAVIAYFTDFRGANDAVIEAN